MYNIIISPETNILKDIYSINDFNTSIGLLIPNISQNEEDDYSFPLTNYFEKLENFSIDDSLKEKSFCQKENNNENTFPLNEGFNEDRDLKNDYIGKKHNSSSDEVKITFKKNRNNLNNNFFKVTKDKNEDNNYHCTNETSTSNNSNQIILSKNRCDSLLIKFKSFLGKSFIKHINDILKDLSKRKIKFYSFNYKQFTLNVTYNQNRTWLNEKMKDLLVLGNESNQEKNAKSLKSLYKKKETVFNEVKYLLELTYKEIIEKFYLTKYFEEFKNSKRVKLLNESFVKIKNVSILEKNGFINFISNEKGNNKK